MKSSKLRHSKSHRENIARRPIRVTFSDAESAELMELIARSKPGDVVLMAAENPGIFRTQICHKPLPYWRNK